MKLRKALIWHSLFWFFYMLALLQYFEYAYTLWENGLIDHPLWSHIVVHHGWWGFISLGLVWVLSNLEDYFAFMEKLRSF